MPSVPVGNMGRGALQGWIGTEVKVLIRLEGWRNWLVKSLLVRIDTARLEFVPGGGATVVILALRRLFGDDHVLDLVVSRLGNHFSGHELRLVGVRAVVDDFLGVHVADTGKRL